MMRLISDDGWDCPRGTPGAGGAGRPRSAPLALTTLLERDDLAPRLDVGKILGQLFGDAEQALAPLHLTPHVLRTHARRNPQHDEIVDEVGALAHDCVAVAVHGVDDDLDRLFGELLGHLGAASTQQAGRTRSRRIRLLGGGYGVIQPVDRITHTQTITRLAVYCVNNVIMPLDLGVTSPDCLSALVHPPQSSGGASPGTTSGPWYRRVSKGCSNCTERIRNHKGRRSSHSRHMARTDSSAAGSSCGPVDRR